MPRMKFDPTINLGHIFTIIALVGSVLLAYTNIVRAIDNHEVRIGTIEARQGRDAVVQERILDTLTTIREDIATLKAQGHRTPP
jgi:hypothetical protein